MNDKERRSDPAMDGARLQPMQPPHQPQLPLSPANLSETGNDVPQLMDATAMWLMTIAAGIDAELQERNDFLRSLLACRGGSNNAATNARKALAHWRLKYNELEADRRAVESALADEMEAVRPLAVALFNQKLKVELLRIDHERAIEAELRYAEKRAVEDRTGVYDAARNVLDRLHEDFGIAEGHWYSITEEGLPALRDVIERENARAGLGSPLKPAIRKKKRAKRSR